MAITSLTDVQALAQKHAVIPVIEELFSGTETPLSIFEKLAGEKSGSFLLESAEQGVWSRFSFIGVNNRGTLLQEEDGVVQWLSNHGSAPLPTGDLPEGISGLDAVSAIQKAWSSEPIADAPPLVSGLVGAIGWDAIREIERLAPAKPKDFNSPTIALSLFSDLVVVDHLKSTVLLVANIFNHAETDIDVAYSEALERITKMRQDLLKPSAVFLADVDNDAVAKPEHRIESSVFKSSVERAKEYVRAGDVLPLDRGAGGRVLMAFSGAPGRLYDKIRKEGYVHSSGDRIPGLVGISAPVWKAQHELVGALTLTVPEGRFKPKFVSDLRKAAASLSESLQ